MVQFISIQLKNQNYKHHNKYITYNNNNMIHRSKTPTPLFHNNNTPTKSSTTPISALNTPPLPIPIPQIIPNESYIQATYATYSSNNWNENKLLLSIRFVNVVFFMYFLCIFYVFFETYIMQKYRLLSIMHQ